MLDNKAEQVKEGQIKVEVNWDEQPLGEMSDTDISKNTGVSVSSVFQNRIKRGIPRYRKDLTGERFGHLVVIELEGGPFASGPTRWICRCDCGNYHTVHQSHLAQRGTRSCGCSREGVNNLRCVTDWDLQPLGEKPDSHIAEDVGVSREAVRLQRSKRGIPRYRPSEEI